MRTKKGQLQISFNMIFSIILIIAFIAVAIFAITKFLGVKDCSLIGMFKEDLKNEIDTAWKGQEKTNNFEGSLPFKIKEVCFIDFSKPGRGNIEYYDAVKKYENKGFNMFFWPYAKICPDLSYFNIEHIDIDKITSSKNPYCIKSNGKVKLKIEKGFNDLLVSIE